MGRRKDCKTYRIIINYHAVISIESKISSIDVFLRCSALLNFPFFLSFPIIQLVDLFFLSGGFFSYLTHIVSGCVFNLDSLIGVSDGVS